MPIATAGSPLRRPSTSWFCAPNWTRATSRTRSSDPSGLARNTILPNCSGVVRRPCVCTFIWNCWSRPIGRDQQFQMNIQTQGRLTTPEQFGDIVLRANPDGSLLRVRDVARVQLGAQNEDVEGRYNGEPAVAIGLYLSPGANAVTTASAVIATMDRLAQRFPPGLHYVVNYDTTTFVRDTIHDVLITLAIAFALVVLVVFVFLGSLRAT